MREQQRDFYRRERYRYQGTSKRVNPIVIIGWIILFVLIVVAFFGDYK